MKKFFLISFLFIFGCGYTPINTVINNNYSITEFNLNGNNQVNTIIKKNFRKFTEKDNLEKQFKINLSSQLIKTTNSKNKSGTNSNLSIQILIDTEVMENNNIIKKFTLDEVVNYNSLDNKFELKQYEKILTENLTNKLLNKIHFTLSSLE